MRSERIVLLTRPRGENHRLASRLGEAGITTRELPCVEVGPVDDPGLLREAIAVLTADDLLVITSVAGARAVAAALNGTVCAAPVAAVGSATAGACRDAGLRVTFTPSIASGRGLAGEVPVPRGKVLFARSDRAAPEPPAILAGRGATVGEIVAYRTISIAPHDTVPEGAVAVFASPSAVDGFALARAPRLAGAVALGANTADRVRVALGIDARMTGPDDGEMVAAIRCVLEDTDAIARR